MFEMMHFDELLTCALEDIKKSCDVLEEVYDMPHRTTEDVMQNSPREINSLRELQDLFSKLKEIKDRFNAEAQADFEEYERMADMEDGQRY